MVQRQGRLGLYEKGMPPMPWAKRFSQMREAGYDFMELSMDESDARLERLDWANDKLNEIRDAAQDQGIVLYSMCLSATRRFPFGSADRVTEERSLSIVRKSIDLCAKMGIRVIQLSAYDAFYEPSTADTGRRFDKNIFKCVEWAQDAGVMLALEPVDRPFCNTCESALRIVNMVNSPWLKIYPDTANLAAAGRDPIDELNLVREHLVALHVKDGLPGALRKVDYGTGMVRFAEIFAFLDRVGFYGPYLIEMWNEDVPDYLKVIKSVSKQVRGYIAQGWELNREKAKGSNLLINDVPTGLQL